MAEDVSRKNKVLIITGGHIEEALLQDCVSKEQYTKIIGADRGLIVADRMNLPLDFIVGDFDSVMKSTLAKYEGITPILTYPTEKDKTDTELAIDLAISIGAKRIDIIGGIGTRLDHTLANIHLLKQAMEQGIDINIIDLNNRIYLRNKSFTIKKAEQHGVYISLIPFTDMVDGLTLKGFKYPLYNITMKTGTSLGISNVLIEDEGIVEFKNGILIVIEAKD